MTQTLPSNHEAEAPHRRIMLVEDDDDLREALAEALIDGGHEVLALDGGREALDRMRSFHPDIVVLDLMMPTMDGWQFRVEQRHDPAIADTPIVAISASQSPAARAIDADLYLQKPLDAQQLLDAIEDVLRTQERRLAPARIAQTERMAALGTLAAGVAHEINNPLTYVMLHLSNAERQIRALETPQNHAKVEQIHTLLHGALEGVERIRGITGGIRTFSRVDDRGGSPHDLRATMDATLQLVMNELKHRARLVKDYGEVPFVTVNEGRLGQVFLNLLTNAVQAIPDQDVGTAEIRITIGTDEQGNAFAEISDTGAGIPEHLRGRIFEPFFTTKPIGQGTGLGLSISHGIVRSAGGELTLTSHVGRGTTFRVTLPPARPTDPKARISCAAPQAAGKPRRILVIDDEPAIGEAVREVLARRPSDEVVVRRSGRDALALLLRDDAFDVILTDVHMDDLSGIDVYRRLMKVKPRLAARMIFMTASALTDDARAFLAGKPQRCVDKPLDMAKVEALISSIAA
jgi:signal transduction histidine kinase